MSPEETAFLADVGTAMVRIVIYNGMEETMFWGIHAALTVAALTSLRRRGLHTRLLKFLFFAVALILILNTYVMVGNWVHIVTMLEYGFVRNIELPIDERWDIARSRVARLGPPQLWLTGNPGLLFLIGDMVVLIRGYILWTRSKVIFAFPIFLLITTFAFTIVSNLFIQWDTTGVTPNEDISSITAITAMSCSIAVNAMVTTVIGYQAFTHRRVVKDTLGVTRSRSLMTLFYLTEAGVLYFVVQVLNLILAVLDITSYSSIDYASNAVQGFAYNISIMYPAMVILLVTYSRSLAGSSAVYDSNGQTFNVESHISFRPADVPHGWQTHTSNKSLQNTSVAWTVDGDVPNTSDTAIDGGEGSKNE